MIGQKVELILQQLTSTSDGMGGSTTKWSSKRRIKGVMETTRGDERFSGDARTLFSTHKFYIDFPIGITITEKDRFIKSERIFEVSLVDNTAEQDRFLDIMMKEIA